MAEPAIALVLGLALAAADETPARRLPAVTTVCRAPATTRCWTEPSESSCKGAEVFRIVIAGADVEAALADCRRPPDGS